jgi:hypothetical protein
MHRAVKRREFISLLGNAVLSIIAVGTLVVLWPVPPSH